MPHLAVLAATKKNRGRKNGSIRFRDNHHRWDPKNQRPELWNLYNARVNKGESIRVFPISNWTELDVWQYIHLEKIPIVPLYFSADAARRGTRWCILIMVDDDRLEAEPMAKFRKKTMVRFRTLGCYPLTGAVESNSDDVARDYSGDVTGDNVGTSGSRHRQR